MLKAALQHIFSLVWKFVMAGVLFVICVPTENYEKSFKISQQENFESLEPEESFCNLLSSSHDNLLSLNEDNPVTRSKISALINKPINILKRENSVSSAKKHPEVTSSTVSDNYEENDINKMPLEKILRKILEGHQIKNAVWTKGESGKYLQVIFPFESGYLCEGILALLNEYGIGQRLNSVVSVIPCSLYYKNDEEFDKTNSEEDKVDLRFKNGHAKNTIWNRFVTSVRARLTVAQVVEGVKADAALTFDFVMLLLVATTLSAIALAENNNVYLVSSMLISPMMGPVMAGTFGQVIQDKKLQKMGVVNEMVGVGIAAAVGFCYGTVSTAFTDKYGESSWPTYEMTSRGEIRTLWVGCLIALLSGAAVALGTLGDNIASLVGVAISASLMPPAVNAGLLWAMATVYAIAGENSSKSIVRTNFYSSNDVLELAALGAVSMCLTFVNIVCIYIAGILVFKIKEVAPLSSKDQSRTFWKHDIKIARNYNRTLQKDEATILSEEIVSFGRKNPLSVPTIKTREDLRELADHLYQSTEYTREHVIDIGKIQHTWSPSTLAPKRPTIQELKDLYFSFLDDKPKAQKNLNFRLHPSHSNRLTPGSSYSNYNQNQNEDNNLATIPENTSSSSTENNSASAQKILIRQAFMGNKKFVVTPAKIDN